MSAEFIFKQSQKEFEKSSICEHLDIYIYFPTINKIDEIDVKCNLIINKVPTNSKNKYFIGVKFESSKITYCSSGDNYVLYSHEEKLLRFTSNKINEFLLKVKNDILPNLKLDKVFGKFVLINDGKKNIQKENVGEDIFGYEYSNYIQCSVCYELTYTRTGCNHPLCVGCWNQIKNDYCPICRNELIMHDNHNDNIDEEESDDDVYYNYEENDDDEEDDDDNDDEEDDDDDDEEDDDDKEEDKDDDKLNTSKIYS